MNHTSLNQSSFIPFSLPDGRWVEVQQDAEQIYIKVDASITCQAEYLHSTPQKSIRVVEYIGNLYDNVWLLAYGFIASGEPLPFFDFSGKAAEELAPCLQNGLLQCTSTDNLYVCDSAMFWQLPEPWLNHQTPSYPLSLKMSDGKYHPVRPPKPTGEVYRRYIPELGMNFSLQTASVKQHAELLYRWMNNPRVDKFWQESGDLAKQTQYLQTLLADPHSLSLIGYFDEQPFAYFEAYWAKEDRIAPFYDADNFDCGIHMLVGEESHRGPHKVRAWLTSLTHYLFLRDDRTQAVVSEPRADNDKMIQYLKKTGFVKLKEFDFPHKRAALMYVHRAEFFQGKVS